MCGKFANLAQAFSDQMLPEYEVIYHFPSVSEFGTNFPPLIRGEAVVPPSGVGTNATSSTGKIPKALFVGGGFTEEELQSILAVPETDGIVTLGPRQGTKEEVQRRTEHVQETTVQRGPTLEMMGWIVQGVKRCLRERGVVEGFEAVVEPGLSRF
ncbi:hypothetical protein LTR37_011807 [Vermiconidia calcicola]|uniref:Uncharacterized protein n=1 Tax=Vermiconidia calcicola TaxID=1690605 RepID=A0ACC3N166_9PEZI|nr:hypothetical protein LTR37_011807 [Vermiconidia calcicola]